MRKLKLQVQISIDGYIADSAGRTDWMIWNWGPNWTWDEELQMDFIDLKSSVDCILLSRNMAEEGFISHWAKVAQNTGDPQYPFAKSISDAKKVVFSKKLRESIWPNTVIAHGNINSEIARLKKQEGKDIIVYGGASFVSSLIKAGVIDEYHLFVNPTALGDGLPIFNHSKDRLDLVMTNTRVYPCGIVVLTYVPKKE